MDKEKKPEFVVTDRRKFNVDGELNPEAEPSTAAPAASQAAVPILEATASTAKPPAPPQNAEPNKAEPQKKPSALPAIDLETGYNGDKERTAFGGQKMEFIHLLDMLVQTAMMYAGAMESGTERRVDIVGLRQIIDLIAVLEEKTRGNLTEQEEDLLKNTVFQLRMTYMEIANMIDRQAMQKAPGAPGTARK